jgi:hypothetical protein
MMTQADYDRETSIRTAIVDRFGGWIVINTDEYDENLKWVIWDLTDLDLGVHYGYVHLEDQDWGIDKECEDPNNTFSVRFYDEETDRICYASPKGTSTTPYWFKEANAKKYAKKYDNAEVVIWYNV